MVVGIQILDWVCASTSLDLFMWLNLEAIWMNLFKNKLEQAYRKRFKDVRVATVHVCRGHTTHVGMRWVWQVLSGHEPQPKFDKFLMGVLIFIGLLVVIVGPAMLFSTLNPVLNLNPVTGVDVAVGVQGDNCLSANVNCPAGVFTLYETRQFEALENVTQAQFEYEVMLFSMAKQCGLTCAVWCAPQAHAVVEVAGAEIKSTVPNSAHVHAGLSAGRLGHFPTGSRRLDEAAGGRGRSQCASRCTLHGSLLCNVGARVDARVCWLPGIHHTGREV